MTYTRISIDPAIMDGVPCIKGTRIPVAIVVAMVADGDDYRRDRRRIPHHDSGGRPGSSPLCR